MDYSDMLQRAQEHAQVALQDGERYAIPQFEVEHEGNKTIVRNCGKVASQLRRSPDHLGKCIIKESGTSGTIENNTLVLNAKIAATTLNNKLQKYCEEYVYCSACEKPDTTLQEEEGTLVVHCEACGEEETT